MMNLARSFARRDLSRSPRARSIGRLLVLLLVAGATASPNAAMAQTVVADPGFAPQPPIYSPRSASYLWDDGAGEYNFKLNVTTGEFGILHAFSAVPGAEYITSVSVAWGAGMNGTAARICVWEDPNNDGNPIDAVLLSSFPVTGANANTNTFNEYTLPSSVKVQGTFFVGFVAPSGNAIFPLRLDAQPSFANGRLWFFGDPTAINPSNLAALASPPEDWNPRGPYSGYAMVRASGTAAGITYQGELREAGLLAAGPVDLRFKLFGAEAGGTQIGPTLEAASVPLVDGKFAVELAFGTSLFDGGLRWLEIAASAGGSGAFTSLTPRQPIQPAPMAHYAYSAQSSISGPWSGLTGIPPGFADGIDNDSGGDITGVTAGAGLTGGATSGNAILAVSFGGSGVAATAARSDHTQPWTTITGVPAGFADGTDNDSGGDITSVAAGTGLSGGALAGNATLNVDFAGTGVAASASRSDHFHSTLAAADGVPSDAVQTDASGNVGVGLVPTQRLHVLSNNIISGTAAAVAGGDFAVTLATGQGIRMAYQGIQSVQADSSANALRLNPVGGGISMFSPTSPPDSVLYVDGSVGIGTLGPEAPLHVFESSAGAIVADAASTLVLERNGSNYLSILTPASSDSGVVFGNANNFVDGSVLYNLGGDRSMYFRTGGNISRMVIGSTGRVGIARAATANLFEVEGSASKTIAGSWLANSDARIKTNVQTVTSALDTLDRVRLVGFEYTPAYLAAHPTIEHRRYLNVIAQEFAQVFPDHVKSSGEELADGSTILQVDTYPLTIYSAAAVQELHTRVKAAESLAKMQESHIESLKAQNEAINRRLTTLEKRLKKLEARE